MISTTYMYVTLSVIYNVYIYKHTRLYFLFFYYFYVGVVYDYLLRGIQNTRARV